MDTPRRPRIHWTPLLASGLAAALLFPVPASGVTAADDVCRVPDAPRVVAVGDVHGAYDSFVSILRFAGILDAKDRWAGGKAVLVQTGDLLDRGKDTRKVLDLLMRLEGDARKAGGRVVALLGNHEAMNILGLLRDVNPAEYASYQEPASTGRREHFYDSRVYEGRKSAKAEGKPFDEGAFRTAFEKQVPLGFVERVQAFSKEGRYGAWLRQLPVMARVNGVVFLHGGLTPEVAALGCEEVNARVRRELNEDAAQTMKDLRSTLAMGESGPLWYRGLAQEDEATLAPRVDQALLSLGARTIVIGHSVTGSGRIEARFGGRVIRIDVGMGEIYGTHLAALEVGPDGSLTALYPEKREEIARPAAAARSRPEPYSIRFAYASR
ncbi:MAG TPA: metallophosphoesterase [Vicinamibacteria bacterium]|nr:metallophosphoesterase [Vicinamibacteria bacterium]